MMILHSMWTLARVGVEMASRDEWNPISETHFPVFHDAWTDAAEFLARSMDIAEDAYDSALDMLMSISKLDWIANMVGSVLGHFLPLMGSTVEEVT